MQTALPPYARANGIRFSGSYGVTHTSQSHDSPGMPLHSGLTMQGPRI